MAIKSVRMPGLVEVSDPGDAGAVTKARGLPIPRFVGQTCVLSVDVAGGNIVVNVGGDGNVAGADDITFTAASQTAHLIGVKLAGALRWRLTTTDPAGLLA